MLPDLSCLPKPLNLMSEESIIRAILDSFEAGNTPSYRGYPQSMLDAILDGSRGIDKEVYDHLPYILPDLKIRYDYLWSPYRQERSDMFHYDLEMPRRR